MPIYFSGSISGGRGDATTYVKIVDHLRALGYDVHGGQVTNEQLTGAGESLADATIFRRDMEWLEDVARRGGLVVAEVSTPSLGVGYEIAAARYRFDIPVVCLYRDGGERRCSAMIAGDPGVTLIRYSDATIEEALRALAAVLDKVGREPRTARNAAIRESPDGE